MHPNETAPAPGPTTHWHGIGKLIEEFGEVLQLTGKAIPFPVGDHPDGYGDVRSRLALECADVYAALDYFTQVNGLSSANFEARRQRKLAQFHEWGLSGIPFPSSNGSPSASNSQPTSPSVSDAKGIKDAGEPVQSSQWAVAPGHVPLIAPNL